MTKCECKMAGYCTRHKVEKSDELVRLCQTSQFYFDLWENCKGPGQSLVMCDKTIPHVELMPKFPETQTLSPLTEQVKNLANDVIAHAKNKFGKSTEEERARRLSICDSCEYLIKESKRCSACGCHVEIKSKWESSQCPLKKW